MNNIDTTPTISVVMSAYNAEEYLEEAITSILNQTFSDFEFIIIEDCSTDKTLEILEHFAKHDPRIKIIKKEQNKGTAGFIENLNIGLKTAKGKYIARMDADDISSLTRFEKQVNFLENNPEIDIVGASIELVDENTKPIETWHALEHHVDIVKRMPKKISLYHPVIMFRKESVESYREKAFFCEDYDLYFNMIVAGKKLANLPEVLLKYRILKTSISRKKSKFTRWLFVEKIRSFYKEHVRTGADTYQQFDPDNFLKVLDLDFKNDKADLLFALRCSISFNTKEETEILYKKIGLQYPKTNLLGYHIIDKLAFKIKKHLIKLIG